MQETVGVASILNIIYHCSITLAIYIYSHERLLRLFNIHVQCHAIVDLIPHPLVQMVRKKQQTIVQSYRAYIFMYHHVNTVRYVMWTTY